MLLQVVTGLHKFTVMKPLKTLFLLHFFLIISITGFAQKKTYDIVSYSPPKDWTEQQGSGTISYSRIDGASWAQIAIYQHRQSVGDIQTDFDKDWNELVAPGRNISGMEKTKPQTADGWTVMSGSGIWQYNGANVASVLTVYSNNQVCVAVLCNSTAMPYMKIYQSLIGSLDLDASTISESSEVENNITTSESGSTSSANSSHGIEGIWTDNLLETSGYSNNVPMYSGGYFRKEYTFKSDGTYFYSFKNWSVYSKSILYGYESGTWTVSNNTLTLTPKEGKKGEWKKTSRTSEWGSLIKMEPMVLEKVSYTFETSYYSGSQSGALLLNSGKSTVRDGTYSGNSFSYALKDAAIIDFPPGFQAGSASKPLVSAASSSVVSSLTGRVWEAKSYEKYPGGSTNPHTGGYYVHQYIFSSNGTYRFVYVGASAYTDLNILKYESGTYTVNGNKLTITPTQGSNEEWSVTGGPVKLSGMSDTQVRRIKESWDKRVKSSQRKLEKNVYTFRIEYMNGNEVNALILEYSKATERESNGEVAYYFETAAEKATGLPKGVGL